MSKLMVNRPARIPPPPVPAGTRELATPPTLPDPLPVNLLQSLLPALLGVGSLLYAIANPNPVAIIAGGLFAVSALLTGVGMYVSSRSAARRRITVNRARYLDYLDQVAVELAETAAAQRAAAVWRHPAPDALWSVAASQQRLWERRPSDSDALDVRIGTGVGALATPLVVGGGDNPLVEQDPIIRVAAQTLLDRRGSVPELPVTVPLRSTRVLSLLGHRGDLLALTAAMIGQLATFHSPRDLRVAVLCEPARLRAWDWAKWLPHAQHPGLADATGSVRSIVTSPAELIRVLGPELEVRRSHAALAAPGTFTHLLVVIDRSGRSDDLGELLWAAPAAGVSVVHMSSAQAGEPPVVDRRVRVGSDLSLDVERSDGTVEAAGAVADGISLAQISALARTLAPLTLSARSSSGAGGEGSSLEAATELTDLLGIADLERFDPVATWARPLTAAALLRAPIGVGQDGRPVHLDLKESALGGMGPHGLMIGATGSGKSELLRTLITALALNHPPELLSFCLVDFKGGAAFANLAELPHVAGAITNLAADSAMIERMHDALFGELRRRQEVLKHAGNLASVREYQELRAGGEPLDPLPVLLVVIDEFGELLATRPEFVDLFVAIGRLGRSLGIHLLFASQRLEEGRLRGLESHLSYRIALRTFSATESRAVIGTDHAYRLPSLPGSGYLKVDSSVDERFRAALVSGPYRPVQDELEAEAEVEQPVVVPFPAVTPPAAELVERRRSAGPGARVRTLLDVAVERLQATGRRVHQVWLPPLPAAVTLDRVLPAARVTPGRGLAAGDEAAWGGLQVTVGLVDRPAEQRQEPLVLDLSGAGGNLAVVGAPQSGKSVLLRTLIASLALTHTPEEAQVYCIDYGGGWLASVAGLPHVGGVATRTEYERVRRILREAAGLLAAREELFRQRRIESVAAFRAMRASGELPGERGEVFLVIDNWPALRADLEDADQLVLDVASRGLGYGIHVVLAANRWADVRGNLKDAFGARLELRIGDAIDSDIDRRDAQLVPDDQPGRGLTEDKLHFLAALPRVDGRPDPLTLAEAAQALVAEVAEGWTGPRALPVRVLPSLLTADDLPQATSPDGTGVVVAAAESDLAQVRLDLRGGDPHFLVFGDGESGKTSFLRAFLRGLVATTSREASRVFLVDLRRTLMEVVPDSYLASYAGSLATIGTEVAKLRTSLIDRLPPASVTVSQLRERSWWTGPDLYVVVDDYDLLAGPGGSPLAPLLELIPQARDVGLHLLLARRAAGAMRASFEPVLQRVKEVSEQGLLLAGDPQEGPLLGGVKASPQPPGRGRLVRRRRPAELVQVLWVPEDEPAASGAAARVR